MSTWTHVERERERVSRGKEEGGRRRSGAGMRRERAGVRQGVEEPVLNKPSCFYVCLALRGGVCCIYVSERESVHSHACVKRTLIRDLCVCACVLLLVVLAWAAFQTAAALPRVLGEISRPRSMPGQNPSLLGLFTSVPAYQIKGGEWRGRSLVGCPSYTSMYSVQ